MRKGRNDEIESRYYEIKSHNYEIKGLNCERGSQSYEKTVIIMF